MKRVYLIVILLTLLFSSACTQPILSSPSVSKRLPFGEHEIYYEVHKGTGSALVFIHGWTGDLKVWKYQLDAFPEHNVIAIDLPGNGRSSRVEQEVYSMEFYADAVRRVLEEEGIDRAFLFGHSMGFAVVEVVNERYPNLCIGIGAIDGAHFEVPVDSTAEQAWLQETEALAGLITSEEGREQFINMLFLPDTPVTLKEEVLATSRTVPLSIGRAMIMGVAASKDYWHPKRKEIPCLAVYSPAYGLPPDYSELFAREYPSVEYHEVDDVSHFYMLEIPDQVNRFIADFVEKHE